MPNGKYPKYTIYYLTQEESEDPAACELVDEPGDHDGQPEQQVRRGQRGDEDVRRPLQSRKGIKYIGWLHGLSLAKLPSPPTLQVPPTHSVHGPIYGKMQNSPCILGGCFGGCKPTLP